MVCLVSWYMAKGALVFLRGQLGILKRKRMWTRRCDSTRIRPSRPLLERCVWMGPFFAMQANDVGGICMRVCATAAESQKLMRL